MQLSQILSSAIAQIQKMHKKIGEKFLQSEVQWQRVQAPGLCNLQQPYAGKHPRQP